MFLTRINPSRVIHPLTGGQRGKFLSKFFRAQMATGVFCQHRVDLSDELSDLIVFAMNVPSAARKPIGERVQRLFVSEEANQILSNFSRARHVTRFPRSSRLRLKAEN